MKPIEITHIKPIRDRVLVTDMEFGNQVRKSGLIIADDDGKAHGIKPRWAKVLLVGPEQKDLSPGQYVLLEHGRWTRSMPVIIDNKEQKMYMIDYPRAVLAIAQNKPIELELVGK